MNACAKVSRLHPKSLPIHEKGETCRTLNGSSIVAWRSFVVTRSSSLYMPIL
jgi:hypothetical protein